MAFKITKDCVQCGICQANCPAHAIKEVDGEFKIIFKFCLLCGECMEKCPVGAIKKVKI